MEHKSLKDHVYEYISHKIQNGEFLPNERITEIEICNEMGVSRTPAREALIQLASDNLLEKIPYKGFIVKQFDKDRKLEIYEVTAVLDGLAGKLAVQHISDEDIMLMQELTEKMDISIKYRNYKEYAKLQNEFHDVYINKCGNDTLISMLNSLRFNFNPQTYVSDDIEKLFRMLGYCNNEHKELVEYMKRRDKIGAESVLKKHWTTLDYSLI